MKTATHEENPSRPEPQVRPVQVSLQTSDGPVCLRGFAADEENRVIELLKQCGIAVTRLLGSAQTMVTGPLIDRALLAQAQKRELRIVAWERCELAEGLDRMAGAGTAQANPIDNPEPQEVLPLVRVEDGEISVADCLLPLRADLASDLTGWVPQAQRFAGVCLDQPFVRTLRAVAMGVQHALPVALEGETAASKTTAVLYLAHLLGQPVIRFNLNGQTDTGELIGRFVPATGSGKSARNGWRFQEGSLPLAMRGGIWLLLDEMNLAEPQILERLNSVLEDTPTLVLTENDGLRFGPGGDVPVDPAFRMFATMNPASYSGRSLLSPAFRDRWTIWHHARTPGEGEIFAMLLCQVFGEQPVVQLDGKAYQAPATAPLYPRLQEVPDMRAWINRLAHFHAAMVKMADPGGGSGGLGRKLRERPVFTRRALLTLLRMVDQDLRTNPVVDAQVRILYYLRMLYLDRLADRSDQRAVESLMRASALI